MPRRTPKTVVVNDHMQRGYRYTLTAPEGKEFDPGFRPELTPKQMLALGVFEGKYLNDCRGEFPASWFATSVAGEGPPEARRWFVLGELAVLDLVAHGRVRHSRSSSSKSILGMAISLGPGR